MDFTDSLHKAIHQAIETEPIAGLAVALLNDKGVAHQYAGVLRRGETQAVSEQTVFSAASLTKPLVAYLALLLVEQGILQLDAPLRHYLTRSYLAEEPRADAITLRHVLSHQCGFPNWRPKDKPLTMHAAPGQQFGYSGEGYQYLQHCLEQLTGARLDVLLHERLLQPLAMSSSSLVWQPFMEGRAAAGHDAAQKWDMPRQDVPYSAYSLYTTLPDYARFVKALLFDAADLPPALCLSPELREQLFAPQVQVGEWPTLFWGLGWGIQSTASGHLVWHWGANYGYRSYAAFSTAHRTGVIILTNHQNGLYTCREIISRLDEPALKVAQPAFDWLLPSEAWKEDGRRSPSASVH
jgi:CubicO group peptidase (beta-lactamase class C family)